MTIFDKAWVFTVSVHLPNLIRHPGLDNPDNWNPEGFDDANWGAAGLVASDVFPKLREAAPAEAIVEDRGSYEVLVGTDDRSWFDQFFQASQQIDKVSVHQEPGRPAPDGENDWLYTYDHNGVIGD